jgi:hypothetical protein
MAENSKEIRIAGEYTADDRESYTIDVIVP